MGKVYRGLSEIYKIPCSSGSPSIPTKYQAVVINNEEKKGFSSQTKRFPLSLHLNETVGPGSYGGIGHAELSSPSFSKRGTTGLASKAARLPRSPRRCIPGPDAYNLQASILNKHSFGLGVSRVFRLPVAVQRDSPKNKTPAPNQYDVCFGGRDTKILQAGSSGFLSKTGRGNFCPNRNMPSPCHYKVSDTLIQKDPKAAISPFKSKTPRFPAPLDNCVPGPGAYNPYQAPVPMKRPVLPRRHYLAISAAPLPVPKDPPLPGPGHYDIVNYDGPSKQLMSSAAFVSKTSRIPQDQRDKGGPGPGFYEPQMPSKQSFFYCHSKVWIPV
ncbi:O(6)-methylguanine-induced apoptosis 2 [Myripristis murdjan]|uniref:Sperm-tail PG-rich repeat containing 1 n=1 Tax=Myripristis murdjan TaxID=586833 RepID=A0A668A9C9_9TELE|nr:O(6)-methylguanine-induced apoptosis 2 [Myripristis murdjan]XP_029919269.1 O(6)-methylguanine-induced apoptosis 2 [Myripristis murdjan]XP_029919270.1 O(6)-methylguanine-induced apoptosis 2 [Myripristis murdjan]XP_029919272.1 O(6)-methylguanine-induced apoptosis 2 [Myripristis murdjan]XP_029919273.1 O(6)-methylguanine-induced apoptosis 2 [Myripristis murdjan]XP_029919274.1 O(6)-methylguanine-induced apoptosis 2 [Myripristis murdjan]